jgi:hypothetical protein
MKSRNSKEIREENEEESE